MNATAARAAEPPSSLWGLLLVLPELLLYTSPCSVGFCAIGCGAFWARWRLARALRRELRLEAELAV